MTHPRGGRVGVGDPVERAPVLRSHPVSPSPVVLIPYGGCRAYDVGRGFTAPTGTTQARGPIVDRFAGWFRRALLLQLILAGWL